MLTSPLAPVDFSLLSDVITAVSRTSRLAPEDAEDFRQHVHLRLLEKGYAPVTQFAGRSSLRTYLTVVVGRQLLDWRDRKYGKWRPCEAARRLGPAAIDLDRLVSRDGYGLDEAVAILASRGADAASLRAVAERLPMRTRPRARTVVVDDFEDLASDEFVDPIEAAQAGARDEMTRARLRAGCAALTASDRQLLHLRFVRGMKVSAMAPLLGQPAKTLYRRLERILAALRAALCDGARQPSSPRRRSARTARSRRVSITAPAQTA